MRRPIFILVCLLALSAQAASAAEESCESRVTRDIPFTSHTSRDTLVVAIGPGACHSAEFTIIVRTAAGKVIYTYAAPFKRHTATQWDDPELPEEARKFVVDTATNALVPDAEIPQPKPRDQTAESEAELTVPAAVFRRLVGAKQPMLYHPTYYEGGQYVQFDPVARRARVVARWGV
jgi:hypothetical protein